MRQPIWLLTLGLGMFIGGVGPDAVRGGSAEGCEPSWGTLDEGLSSTVRAMVVFDDGNGPALYAGGDFTNASGTPASRIARWDGTSWSPLGAGVDAAVWALAVFDDGNGPALYAAGDMLHAGGSPANFIARWDGTSWSPLGSGLNSWVNALAVHDDGSGPALYAGGYFLEAGGTAVNRVARWDGTSWSAVGSELNNKVDALCVYDDGTGPALYAGGIFTSPGTGIARWDGESWSAVGAGVSGGHTFPAVRAMAVFDDGNGPALFAGGLFTHAGGSPANRLARWDGETWTAQGEIVDGAVACLTVLDRGNHSVLYAGGMFEWAGGNTTSRAARLKSSGSSWAALPADLHHTPLAMTTFDDGGGEAMYVGGGFVYRIRKWQPCECVGDLNSDGLVDADDLSVLLGAYGGSADGDLDGNGVTDADDLGILLGVYGSGCE